MQRMQKLLKLHGAQMLGAVIKNLMQQEIKKTQKSFFGRKKKELHIDEVTEERKLCKREERKNECLTVVVTDPLLCNILIYRLVLQQKY